LHDAGGADEHGRGKADDSVCPPGTAALIQRHRERHGELVDERRF